MKEFIRPQQGILNIDLDNLLRLGRSVWWIWREKFFTKTHSKLSRIKDKFSLRAEMPVTNYHITRKFFEVNLWLLELDFEMICKTWIIDFRNRLEFTTFNGLDLERFRNSDLVILAYDGPENLPKNMCLLHFWGGLILHISGYISQHFCKIDRYCST